MSYAAVFSVLFLISCGISIFFGIYALTLSPKNKINRLFFYLTLSLSIWSFGYGLQVISPDIASCLFWRRISVFGSGSFFAFLLNFILEYAGKQDFLKKKWVYVFLYSPFIFSLFCFTFYTGLNPNQYDMVLTKYGWANIFHNSFWNDVFSAYYIIFSALSFAVLVDIIRHSDNKQVKKDTCFFLYSVAAIVLIGSFTDHILNMAFSFKLPQISPILISMPIILMFATTRRLGLLSADTVYDDGFLLSDHIHSRSINYFSLLLIFGAILNIISQYIVNYQTNGFSVFVLSGLAIACGILFLIISRLNIKQSIKDLIVIAIVTALIPIITLRFLKYGGLTIWAASFVILLAALVFERKYVLIMISVSTVLSQIYVWYYVPAVTVQIDARDYIVRLGLFTLAVWIASRVKGIFIAKLNENSYQLNMQKLMVDLSSNYVSVNPENFDEKTNLALKNLGEFFCAAGVCVALYDSAANAFICKYFWAGDSAANVNFAVVSADKTPWMFNRLISNSIISTNDLSETESDARTELKLFCSNTDNSFIAMPIVNKGSALGYLGIVSRGSAKKWSGGQQDFFMITSNILADSIMKVRQEREISNLAYYDYLTKVPNRILFTDRVSKEISEAADSGTMFALFFLDLDMFKNANDTLGHVGGDELLVKISEEIVASIEKTDTICRFGGDEFLIMVNNLTCEEDIILAAEVIFHIFDKRFIVRGHEFHITASIGISVFPRDGADAEALIKSADISLRKAKEDGKNQYRLCSEAIINENNYESVILNDLRKAIERNELVVHYQPQIDIRTHRIAGIEALVRWNHPEMGLIYPSTFIHLAEQSELIVSIGEWVLRTACLQNKAWQDAGLPPIRIAVNVSLNQLRSQGLITQVKSILAETALDPACLELEITESVAMIDEENIVVILDTFKNMGISISIDDFGTGYSSLSRLRSMPVDKLKIDMEFVRGIGKSQKNNSIVEIMIDLAHSLGMKAVFEGIEDISQLEFLREHNGDEAQGFYFFQPIQADELCMLLAEINSTASAD